VAARIFIEKSAIFIRFWADFDAADGSTTPSKMIKMKIQQPSLS